MAISQSKENVLKKIRQALSHPVSLPFPHSEGNQSVFHPAEDDLAVIFAQHFTALQGKFAYCENTADLINQINGLIKERGWEKIYSQDEEVANWLDYPLYHDLPTCNVSITNCECLVARTGTMVLSSALPGGRTASIYAPAHICIAYSAELFYDLKDAMDFLKSKYGSSLPSQISFASGPSRTADIEKTLVTGVHGPKDVYCFLTEAS